MIKKVLLLFLLLLFVGCTKVLPPEEYLKAANSLDGPLVTRVEQGAIDFTCFYRPTAFYIAQQIDFDSSISDSAVEEVRKQYKDATYFALSIDSKKHNPNMMLFGSSFKGDEAHNLLYRLGSHFSLISKKDMVDCKLATINRSWGVSSEVILLIVFPRIEEKKLSKYTLKINDFGLGCGTVMLPLKKIKPKKIALQF